MLWCQEVTLFFFFFCSQDDGYSCTNDYSFVILKWWLYFKRLISTIIKNDELVHVWKWSSPSQLYSGKSTLYWCSGALLKALGIHYLPSAPYEEEKRMATYWKMIIAFDHTKYTTTPFYWLTWKTWVCVMISVRPAGRVSVCRKNFNIEIFLIFFFFFGGGGGGGY